MTADLVSLIQSRQHTVAVGPDAHTAKRRGDRILLSAPGAVVTIEVQHRGVGTTGHQGTRRARRVLTREHAEHNDIGSDVGASGKRRQVLDLTRERVRRELVGDAAVDVDSLEVVLHLRTAREELQVVVSAIPADREPARKVETNLVARRPVEAVLGIDDDRVARHRDVVRVKSGRVPRAPRVRGRIVEAVDRPRGVEGRIEGAIRTRERGQTAADRPVVAELPVDAHAVLPETGDERHGERVAERAVEVVQHRAAGDIDVRVGLEIRTADSRPARRGGAVQAGHRAVDERRLRDRSREDTEHRRRNARRDLEEKVIVEHRVLRVVVAIRAVRGEGRDALDVVANLERVGLNGRRERVAVEDPLIDDRRADAAAGRRIRPVGPGAAGVLAVLGVLNVARRARQVQVLGPERRDVGRTDRHREGAGDDRVELARKRILRNRVNAQEEVIRDQALRGADVSARRVIVTGLDGPKLALAGEHARRDTDTVRLGRRDRIGHQDVAARSVEPAGSGLLGVQRASASLTRRLNGEVVDDDASAERPETVFAGEETVRRNEDVERAIVRRHAEIEVDIVRIRATLADDRRSARAVHKRREARGRRDERARERGLQGRGGEAARRANLIEGATIVAQRIFIAEVVRVVVTTADEVHEVVVLLQRHVYFRRDGVRAGARQDRRAVRLEIDVENLIREVRIADRHDPVRIVLTAPDGIGAEAGHIRALIGRRPAIHDPDGLGGQREIGASVPALRTDGVRVERIGLNRGLSDPGVRGAIVASARIKEPRRRGRGLLDERTAQRSLEIVAVLCHCSNGAGAILEGNRRKRLGRVVDRSRSGEGRDCPDADRHETQQGEQGFPHCHILLSVS